MATGAEEYAKARKLATKEQHKALSQGRNPYLHALDDMLTKRTTLKEESVGTREIPLAQVVGTVTKGRQESFARNFMPLLGIDTEFASKWISLIEYQMEEGISDAIKVIEFMGKFYVLEGNKRVSVLKYLEQPTILATITRVLPPESDDVEVVIYYEFLKFFKCTGIYNMLFTHVGSYDKLAEALGLTYDERWDDDIVMDLKSAFLNFSIAYEAGGGKAFSITPADAFLVYIESYKYESLVNTPADEIRKNLGPIWPEIRILANGNQITFSEEPQLHKKSTIPILDTIFDKPAYNEQHPLKIGFLYDGVATKSRWINGHEMGRAYLESKYPGVVETFAIDGISDDEEFDAAVEKAAAVGTELIFTTSPIQMDWALRAAVKHPEIKFMNCSVHFSHGAVRTYYGRMYEAKFMLGIVAGTLAKDNRIAYVSTYPICGNIANINAFAIGASLVNPKAKIHLTWSCLKDEYWREYVRENDFHIVSGPDLIKPKRADNEYGLYAIGDDGEVTNIAFAEWKWGKYYELIVKTILNNAWNAQVDDAKDSALNYWWGMASGVIDINLCNDNIPYSTRKMIEGLRRCITADSINPFEGELRSQTGVIKDPDSPRLSNSDIINMNWLNDNIEGTIPSFEELTEKAQMTVKANGIPLLGENKQ
ncbi:MAG: BMP family ABC transporter substrate-binding protein [Clostridiales bacterium]|nr:BMP family ABC transporter substrate-binding protein [Clostridiales bacterium]